MSVRRRTWITKKGERREAWVVDYADQAGVRHIASFERKRDADAYDAEVRTEVRVGIHTAPSISPTMTEAIADWLERAKTEQLEPATQVQYRQLCVHIEQHLGAIRLANLTTPGVHAFRDTLRRTVSRTMARKVLTALVGVIKEAQRRGNVAQNVAAGVTVGADRRKARIEVGRDIPSADELRRILEAVTSPRTRSLLVTAALTGLRASELRGLMWDDVDLKRGELHVRQRADRYGTIGRLKSRAGRRTVPLGPMVVNALKSWRLASTSTGLVFGTRTGKCIGHPDLWQRMLAPAQIMAGVVTADGKPKYSFHSLRHFYASWCINPPDRGGLGLQAKVVQQRLGHASIVMTLDTYGHLFPSGDDGAELAEAERRLLTPIKNIT
jgi:integrase